MPRDIPPLAEVRRITEKKRDAWWTVMLVDPVATPLVRWTARHTRATPNQLTWGAFLVGLGSAACFAQGDWRWLLLGAALYHVSFIFDCMDGKLARLTGTGSVFGAWLDFVFDRIRVLVCSVALMGGQYARTDDVLYLWLALAVASLDSLRYIDSLEIFKIRHGMRKQIKARMRAARKAENQAELAFMEDLLRETPRPIWRRTATRWLRWSRWRPWRPRRLTRRPWRSRRHSATAPPSSICTRSSGAASRGGSGAGTSCCATASALISSVASSSRWACSSSARPSTRWWRRPSYRVRCCSSSNWPSSTNCCCPPGLHPHHQLLRDGGTPSSHHLRQLLSQDQPLLRRHIRHHHLPPQPGRPERPVECAGGQIRRSDAWSEPPSPVKPSSTRSA
ncbi:hypothetical protein GCM10017744_031620 [Streptomyces antimycoticus]